jgi:hypothetical protein
MSRFTPGCLCCSGPPPPTGTLCITVLGCNGKVIPPPGAAVTVTGPNNYNITQFTDNTGSTCFAITVTGSYGISISDVGFAPIVEPPVTVTVPGTVYKTFKLSDTTPGYSCVCGCGNPQQSGSLTLTIGGGNYPLAYDGGQNAWWTCFPISGAWYTDSWVVGRDPADCDNLCFQTCQVYDPNKLSYIIAVMFPVFGTCALCFLVPTMPCCEPCTCAGCCIAPFGFNGCGRVCTQPIVCPAMNGLLWPAAGGCVGSLPDVSSLWTTGQVPDGYAIWGPAAIPCNCNPFFTYGCGPQECTSNDGILSSCINGVPNIIFGNTCFGMISVT